MPNPFHYRSIIQRLAGLADASNPAHVSLAAAATLARELSPANPRRESIQRLLRDADPFAFARHKLRDLYDRAEPLGPEPAQDPLEADPLPSDDEPLEEDDDPW